MTKVVAAGVFASIFVLALPVASGAQRPPGPAFDGPGSSIGVSVRELTDETGKGVNADGGAVIERVQEGSPAATAGFQAGDVVVEFDGERVRSARQFARIVQETRPNRAVDAVVIRQGSRQTLKVTPELGRAVSVVPDLRGPAGRELNLRSAPFSLDLDAFGRGWFAPAGGRLGAAVMPLDDQLATYFGVAEGVLVTSVSANTPAAAAGLRAGDVIIAVGGRNVAEASEVNEAIRAVAPGAMVDIRVVREKKEITVTATLPRPERQRTGTRVTI